MSTHNICFHGEIKKKYFPDTLLFRLMLDKVLFSGKTLILSKMPKVMVLIMPPHPPWGGWWGRHIVFSVDPVSVGVATCLHSISLLNGQILAKLTQIYHWEGEKC